MDIVSRIKLFIEQSSITNSQFADTCSIPRPTISQLLNGRNKKVSDEIICKIHSAFPNLSISWLMFNEGEMLIDPEKPNSAVSSENSIFPTDTLNLFKNENLRESSNPTNKIVSDGIDITGNIDLSKFNSANPGMSADTADFSNTLSKVTNPASERKVVNIIVFYSDNSFEHFKPVQK